MKANTGMGLKVLNVVLIKNFGSGLSCGLNIFFFFVNFTPTVIICQFTVIVM
jgi:hypothetical protein